MNERAERLSREVRAFVDNQQLTPVEPVLNEGVIYDVDSLTQATEEMETLSAVPLPKPVEAQFDPYERG